MAIKQKPKPLPSSEWIAMDPDGVTWTDLFVSEDPRFPDVDRIASIDWIAKKWFARPIAPQRFMALDQRILTALKDRAGAHGTTPEAELQQSVIQALLLALGEMEDIGDIFAPEPRKEIRKRLNRLVVEDLLAPDWEHVPSQDLESLEDLISEEATYAEVEATLELDSLIAKAPLSKAEAEIVTVLRQGFNFKEAGDYLGIKEGTARARWHRAKQKLRAITDM